MIIRIGEGRFIRLYVGGVGADKRAIGSKHYTDNQPCFLIYTKFIKR